jgi:hypothetical protein
MAGAEDFCHAGLSDYCNTEMTKETQTAEEDRNQPEDPAQDVKKQTQPQDEPASGPGIVTGAAADHQREIVLEKLAKLIPNDKKLNDELGKTCAAHGGNCTFSMNDKLRKEVNAAMGAPTDFRGSTYGAHSRVGFSPSLHHNHQGNQPSRLHIDHFNGRSVFGFLPHEIVDVSIGTVFYGNRKVFSY